MPIVSVPAVLSASVSGAQASADGLGATLAASLGATLGACSRPLGAAALGDAAPVLVHAATTSERSRVVVARVAVLRIVVLRRAAGRPRVYAAAKVLLSGRRSAAGAASATDAAP